MNVIERVKERQNLIADINDVLQRHGMAHRVRLEDLSITDKVVTDGVIQNSFVRGHH